MNQSFLCRLTRGRKARSSERLAFRPRVKRRNLRDTTLALSVYAGRRVKNEEDYIIAGRQLPLWLAFSTLLATWIGAETILGVAQAAREEGVRGTILEPFASGIALIIAGIFFAKPLWEMKLLTIGDFYGRAYGPRAELLASCVLVPSYFGWIGAQFLALGELQEIFFGIPTAWGIVIGASFILIYAWVGGMWSVAITDAIQLIVLMTCLIILGYTVLRHAGGISTIFRKTDPEFLLIVPKDGLAAMMAWTATVAIGCFGNISGQDLMQRVFACRDANTARIACVLAGVAYLIVGLLPVAIGLASKILVPGDEVGTILGVLAHEFLTPTLTAVSVVLLVSVIVSTATSAVLAPATLLGHNLLAKTRPFRDRKIFVQRIAVPIIGFGGILMAFSGDTILGLFETALSIVFVGNFTPLVMGLYGKPKGELSGTLSIICGVVAWVGGELLEGVVLPVSLFALAAGSNYAYLVMIDFWGISGMLIYIVTLFPSAILGIIGSLTGYFTGQFLLQQRLPK